MRRAAKGRAAALSAGLSALLLAGVFAAHLGAQAQVASMTPAQVGPMTRAQVEALTRAWSRSDRELDAKAIRMLAQARAGADVKVYFGTWCQDSQREVPRFLKIVEDIGVPPFAVEFIAVDEEKKQPARLLAAEDVSFLPTFVVSLKGREVGRIVARPPRGLETDLALLLAGKETGLITASEDVIWHYLGLPERAPRRPR